MQVIDRAATVTVCRRLVCCLVASEVDFWLSFRLLTLLFECASCDVWCVCTDTLCIVC